MAAGNNGKLALSERSYDFFKNAAQLYIPALAVLYAALAGIWSFPDAVQVVGSLAAIDTFLGVVLKISSVSYNAAGGTADGSLQVDSGYPSKVAIDLTPEALAQKTSLVLNVDHLPPVIPVTTAQDTPGSPMTPGTASQ